MEVREHVTIVLIQHEHVVHSQENVQIERHHEVMDMRAVISDVVHLEDVQRQ